MAARALVRAGTCRLLDGAYFCGDHSCATYKHIGQKATTRSTQVVDRVVDTECATCELKSAPRLCPVAARGGRGRLVSI